MLSALVAYAEREGLGDPDFETRSADYELRIAQDGSFVGLVTLGDRATGRAPIGGLPIGPPSKNNPGYPNFLVDNAQYVLGTSKKNAAPGNAKKCFESFVALVARAAGATNDDGLVAFLEFLRRSDQIARADEELAAREAAKSNRPETSAKNVEGRGDRILLPVLHIDGARRMHEREKVVAWWKAERDAERASAAAGPLGRCLVTGALAPIADIHPAIVGSPFPTTGAKLVAFNRENPAFASNELEQGENAPVSQTAARKYTAALNALLERDPATGRRRSAIDLDGESVVVFWTRTPSDAAGFVLDVLSPPATGQQAADAARAAFRGVASRTFGPAKFYATTLGANRARVVVRDWFETTADDIKRALDLWFSDLQLGRGEPEPVPLPALLRALEATPGADERRGLPSRLATALFRAALTGTPLPATLLPAALSRMRLAPRDKEPRDVVRFRASLIKAVLRRTYGKKEIDVALDESNSDPAYLLGRLFAVLERLQGASHGDVNASIRDRWFGAASTTPASVFPRLIKLSAHHESKLRGDPATKGLAIYFDRLKTSIVGKLDAKPLPAALDLPSQGMFAIGYYHQRDAKKQNDEGGSPT